MASNKFPVAVVTGGLSGIGLSVAKRLAGRGYKLFIADISAQDSTDTLIAGKDEKNKVEYVRTDVSSWDSQKKLFETVSKKAGHIDVFIANAGIADAENFYASDNISTAPSIKTLDVDLNGVLYGLKLFMHHTRKDRSNGRQSKFIVTSSMMGIYPFATNPVYSAAKHATIGLVRSVGPRLLKEDNMAVNAILPAFIDTGLGVPCLRNAIEQAGHLTPMETMMRAYDKLLDANDFGGATLEVSGDHIYTRKPVDFCDDTAKWLVEDPDRAWDDAYRSLWNKSA